MSQHRTTSCTPTYISPIFTSWLISNREILPIKQPRTTDLWYQPWSRKWYQVKLMFALPRLCIYPYIQVFLLYILIDYASPISNTCTFHSQSSIVTTKFSSLNGMLNSNQKENIKKKITISIYRNGERPHGKIYPLLM